MWWRLILVLVIWKQTISSHPTEYADRVTHIINGREVECCPCTRSAPPRSADCPCADADGAPSMLFPKVLQLGRSATTADPNEEAKPILHPEVDLASSMLETLREVTEEEYQDAVARDAARSAARSSNQDETNLEDSADTNLVTILINPESQEDAAPKASEVKESRCSLDKERSLAQGKNLLTTKLFDMHNAASAIQERVAGINKGLEGLKLRNNKLLSPNLSESKVLKNKPDILSLNQLKAAHEKHTENALDLLKVPNFRLNRPLKKIHYQVRPLNLNKLGAKKNKISDFRSNEDEESLELDNGSSPSDKQEQFTISPLKKHKNLLGIPSLIDKDKRLIKKPFTLNTIWKLKDVELIPPIQTKINIPSLDLPPPVPKSSLIKTTSKSNDIDCNAKIRDDNPNSNIQVIPRDKTNILDAVPSPSDNHINIVEKVKKIETATIASDEVDVDPTITNSNEQQLLLNSDEIVAENAHQLQNSPSTENSADSKTPQDTFDYDETVGNSNSDITIDGADYVDMPQDINFSSQDESVNDVNVSPESFDTLNSQDSSLLPEDEAEIIIVSNDPQITEEVPVSIEFNPFEDSDTGSSNDFTQIAEDIINFDIPNIELDPNFRSAESSELKTANNAVNQTLLHQAELERSGDLILEPSETIQDQSDGADIILDRESSNEDTAKVNIDNDQRKLRTENLQQLSDSLLEASKAKHVKEDDVSDDIQCLVQEKAAIESENADLGTQESGDNEASDISDIETASTNLDAVNSETAIPDVISKENVDAEHEYTNRNVFEKPNEMDTGASEHVSKTVPQNRASLMPNVLQPTIFGGGNFPLLPVNRNLFNIPGLEELNPRLNDILGLGSRNAETSDEFEDSRDCADAAGKSSDASSGAQTLIPSFRPFEDLDLDIFRINPFNQKNALSAKMPTLDLNTFKTRLALPDSLDLRPVRLQSSLGNSRDGLLGATLTFGPDKLGSSNKMKSSNSKSALSSSWNHPKDILRSSLPTLPSFEELRDTMRSNAENLLSSPLTSTLRSSPISSLSDNLRTHTENTVRNIQNSFTSKLSQVAKNPKYAQPESLLEKISSAREDLGDKLQAIHIDLTDRLSSVHDRIFDKDRLSSIPLPLSESSFNSKANTLQSPEPKGKFKIHKHPKSKSKSASNSNTAQSQIRPFKMSKAASSLSPKSVEVPKLTSVSTEPTFTRNLQNELNTIKEIRAKSQVGQQRAAFSVQTNKNKITSPKSPNRFSLNRGSSGQNTKFNTDSRGHASEPQPIVVPHKTLAKKSSNVVSQLRKATPTVKPLTVNDKRKTISPEGRSHRPVAKAVTKSLPSSTKIETSTDHVARATIAKPKTITIPKSVTPKIPLSLARTLPQPNVSDKLRPLTFPTSENPLITEIRKALRARFPNLNPKLTPTKATFNPKPDDMFRAASENSHVIAEGTPLKENVSYRCKMVCVKEPIEKK